MSIIGIQKLGNLVPTDRLVEQFPIRINSLALPNFPQKSNILCKWVPLCELVFLVIWGFIFTLQYSLHMTLYVFCSHHYFERNRVKMFWNFDFSFYCLFKNEILSKTSFITIIDETISIKWISSSSHELEALLLTPKLLMPRKSQLPTVGILPNNRS